MPGDLRQKHGKSWYDLPAEVRDDLRERRARNRACQRMQNDAQAIQQRITDGANSLSADKLAELNKELEDASIALRRYRDDKQREGQKMQEDGLIAIEEVLQPIFGQVRDEMGFDLILNRVPGVVLMISERVDITPLMVQRLNSATSGGS